MIPGEDAGADGNAKGRVAASGEETSRQRRALDQEMEAIRFSLLQRQYVRQEMQETFRFQSWVTAWNILLRRK